MIRFLYYVEEIILVAQKHKETPRKKAAQIGSNTNIRCLDKE